MLNGQREYVKAFKDLEAFRIDIYPTAPYMPQENAVAESMSCTAKDCIWTLLIGAGAPASFSAGFFYSVCDVCNWALRLGCMKTPEELLIGLKASFGNLQIFGCKVWTRVRDKSVKRWMLKRGLVLYCDVYCNQNLATCLTITGL